MRLHLRPKAEGTTQSDQGSIASALKTIYGHKRMPRRKSVGARMTPFGDEERMSVRKTYLPAVRSSVTGITYCAVKVVP